MLHLCSDSSDSSSSSGSSSSGSSKDCFIATVAYGSAMEPKVKLLREFRDSFLLTNSVGKKLVELYYHCSPPAADFIRDHEILRKLVGISLLPLVGISWVSLKLGATTTTLMLLLFVCGMLATIYYLKRKKHPITMISNRVFTGFYTYYPPSKIRWRLIC